MEQITQTIEQRFRATFEQAAVGMAHVSPEGRFMLVNQKLCEIVGYSRNELLRLTFQDITYPDDLEADLEYVQQLLSGTRETYSMEKRYIRADESLVWINLTVSLVRDEQGIPQYFISVIEDINKRKWLEEELARERQALFIQRQVAETNVQTTQEVVRQMDEFLGIVSHELKAPLTTLQASLQLLKRQFLRQSQPEGDRTEPAPPTPLSLLERAERQVKVQNRLINDLLDVSRIHSNRLELSPRLINLTQLVQEIIEDQRNLAPTRTIRLKTSPLEVLVFADADRVGQVVNNYLSNALKYSEASRPVEVRIFQDGQTARVAVTDEGPGLSEQQQERIWQRFYRVPNIEVKSGSDVGLGLGLHICQTIIERQSGQVGVQSNPGHGSTFWFTLPLA